MNKKKNHNQFVRCLENIQDLSGQGHYEYAMIVGGGGMFSRKTIKYNPKTKKYSVKNHIDNSRFTETAKSILNPKLTMLGEAMRKAIGVVFLFIKSCISRSVGMQDIINKP